MDSKIHLKRDPSVFAFSSGDAYRSWLETTTYGHRIPDFTAMTAETRRRYESADYNSLSDELAKESREIERQVQELAKGVAISPSSREFIVMAAQQISLSNDAIGDPLVIHDAPNFGGNYCWLWRSVPDLNIVGGWDNRVVSAQIINDLWTLTSDPWWRGRRLYLFGVPFNDFPDLNLYGFDRVARSAFQGALFP